MIRRAAPSRAAVPSLAVVIPSYDRPEAVCRAVASVLCQRAFAEIVVVDDASPRPVQLGLPADDPRVRLIRHDCNRGVCAARNTGMQATRATHLVFLDDDDRLLPWAGHLYRRWIARAPDDISVGGVAVHGRGGRPDLRRPPSSRAGEIWGLDGHLIAGGRSINTKQAAAIPRALLDRAGGWDEDLRSRSSSEMFYRLTALANVRGYGLPVYLLNRGPHGKLTADPDRRRDSHRHIRAKHAGLLDTPARRATFDATHEAMMARTAD